MAVTIIIYAVWPLYHSILIESQKPKQPKRNYGVERNYRQIVVRYRYGKEYLIENRSDDNLETLFSSEDDMHLRKNNVRKSESELSSDLDSLFRNMYCSS